MTLHIEKGKRDACYILWDTTKVEVVVSCELQGVSGECPSLGQNDLFFFHLKGKTCFTHLQVEPAESIRLFQQRNKSDGEVLQSTRAGCFFFHRSGYCKKDVYMS